MASARRRHQRIVTALSVASLSLLSACGSSSTGSSGNPAAASANLPKTLVFSPLSLAPPALKGLSEGVKG